MNDHETILVAADILRAEGLPVYLYLRKQGDLGIHGVGLKRAKRYAETLLPYLTGTKHRAASLVLRFIESREASPSGAAYTEEQIELVRELRGVNGNGNTAKTPL